jgi:hypothetical protein
MFFSKTDFLLHWGNSKSINFLEAFKNSRFFFEMIFKEAFVRKIGKVDRCNIDQYIPYLQLVLTASQPVGFLILSINRAKFAKFIHNVSSSHSYDTFRESTNQSQSSVLFSFDFSMFLIFVSVKSQKSNLCTDTTDDDVRHLEFFK